MHLKYIMRLDDACPTMDVDKWNQVESIFNLYGIKPIVGVIPNNKDPKMMIDLPDPHFWNKVRKWQHSGWHIGLHGYDHCYISNSSGIVPMNRQSEFAGVEKEIQREKLRKSLTVFSEHDIKTNIFVAPSHTFDSNTLAVLRDETDIKIISDGVAVYPYKKDGFFWIPQQLWQAIERKRGVWTFCYHPNDMKDANFEILDKFCNAHRHEFVSNIEELMEYYGNRNADIMDKLYFSIYFTRLHIVRCRLYKYIFPTWHRIKRALAINGRL